MIQIANEAKENPEIVLQAPMNTPLRRLDEATANRTLDIRWKKETMTV